MKNQKKLNKTNKKINIPIHLDYDVSDKCLNLSESYGEICVKCGKCGRKFFNGIMAKNEKEAKNIKLILENFLANKPKLNKTKPKN